LENKSHRLVGALLNFLLFLKANKETFEQILTFPFHATAASAKIVQRI
jgi:hypothetical protein